ncbi:hypothetical protein [Bradyrhizobium sp. USDA 4532]|uniref:hypothetical protein n=1 Tax=unclassified Bradyrhizobium TaxID=2631580 RepID=UPI0035C67B3C
MRRAWSVCYLPPETGCAHPRITTGDEQYFRLEKSIVESSLGTSLRNCGPPNGEGNRVEGPSLSCPPAPFKERLRRTLRGYDGTRRSPSPKSASPGHRRKRTGTSFSYYDKDGKRITDKAVIRRIKSIGIPSADKFV